MKIVGEENVFVLSMDGSCARALELFNEKYKNKFGQRCATSGALPLYFDIGRGYLDEITIAKDLINFIVNHGYVLELLRITGAISLYGLSETSSVNVVCSPEIAVKEKEKIQLFRATPALLSWIDEQSSEVNLVLFRLRDKLVLSEKMWQNLEFPVNLQGPLRLDFSKK